jgi:heme/copper-type cytochrome/quinol oxidase subunit 3
VTRPMGALAASFVFTASCDYDCGDQGGRGLFVLVLLCTPVAALGVLLLAAGRSDRRGRRWPVRLALATVALCTLLLAGSTVAAAVAGVDNLTGQPRAGRWWLGISGVLGLMTVGASRALWIAWRRRAQAPTTG